MKKNKITDILLSCCLLSLTLTSYFSKDIDGENSFTINNLDNQKISIKEIKYKNSSTSYGIQEVSYTIGPKISNDTILYDIKYIDNENVEEGIFNICIDVVNNKVFIECLKPFNKQVILTLYSKSNENVKATTTLDFKEKITVNPNILISEGEPLLFDANITSTGGSIKIDKQVKHLDIMFNEEFVNKAKQYLYNTYIKNEFKDFEENTYTLLEERYMGFDVFDAELWFESPFMYCDFYNNFYIEANYAYIVDGEEHQLTTVYTIEYINRNEFEELFDGINPVFDFSFMIADKQYESQCGILAKDIPMDEIIIEDETIVF